MEKKSIKRIVLITALVLLLVGCVAGLALAETAVNAKDQSPSLNESATVEDGFHEEDGQTVYYLNGEKVYGFLSVNGKEYYFADDTGYMAKGFTDIGDYRYYFDKTDGHMLKGFQNIGKYRYYFSKKNGQMLKGFQDINGYRYYFKKSNGRMVKGFKDIGQYSYYFYESSGHMARGFTDIGDYRYYFNKDDGRMAKGLKTVGKYSYYFDKETGHMVKGFQDIGKYRYYFKRCNGRMAKGFVKISGHKYYFKKANGRMVRGFYTVDGYKYYFNRPDGEMLTGLQTIGKYQYYFNKKTGRMFKGFKKLDGSTYYFSRKNGRMRHGFQKIDGNKYYFSKKTGKMYTGLHKISGDVYTFNKSGILIRSVYADKKAICLTFDDGPSPNTSTIMKALKDNGGLATFFVVGNRLSTYKDTLIANSEQGNQIANHSWSHPAYSSMTADAIRDEITKTNKLIKEYTGKTPTVTRTPYGITSESVNAAVNMPIIIWSVDTLDWQTQSADSTYNSILNHAKDGAVVLMHDLYSATASGAVRAIPVLVERGYQLVTIDEMALLKGVKLEKGKAYYSF